MALVLIVDDDDAIREVLAEILTEAGYAVELACNGADALDRLQTGCAPSVILLDLMMPVMNGWTFLEQLSAAGGGALAIPVVVLTAGPTRLRANLPTAEVLAKPVDVGELLEALSRASGAAGATR